MVLGLGDSSAGGGDGGGVRGGRGELELRHGWLEIYLPGNLRRYHMSGFVYYFSRFWF